MKELIAIATVSFYDEINNTTASEKIVLSEHCSQEELMEAVRGAAAYDFIQELPKGIDTVIGEKGLGLSEGQVQRISIARAILKNSPVLVMD